MDPALEELLAGEAAEELEVVLKLRGAAAPPGVRVVARFGPVVTGRVERGRLRQVRAHPEVVSVKAPRLLALEDEVPLEASPLTLEPLPSDVRRPADLPETGRGVVIGVVDVGCDFAHPHFRRADGSTRLLAFWDQRPASAPAPSNRYGYGRIHTAAAINRALASPDPYAALGYHPAAADPLGIGAHGTLVLDIAAGNGSLPGSPMGLAPEADLVFVQVATEALPGLANLGDSVRLLEALDFIRRAAGRRPWVGHLSLGRRGGPHDGLSLVEQALDHLVLEAPGRAVVLSCGNYFASGAHASGQMFNGRSQTFTWITDRADVTPNELEVWYPGRDVLLVELRPPTGDLVFRAAPGENVPIVIEGRQVGHLYHRARDPNNGDNHIDIFLKPAAPAGSWQVTLRGEAVVDGRVHLWVERDAPCYRCDSRFPAAEADPFSTIGTICNGFYTVAVGAYDAHAPELRLAPFSSAGPTRDGRQKPDLLAPGVNVLGARSAPPEGWGADLPRLTRQSGTSFAAPQVTGTIALMFEAAAQPLDIHTTRRLLLAHTREPHFPPSERPRLGSGLLDVARAVAAAREGETAMTRPTITFQEPVAEPVPEARESWEEEDWPEREGGEALSLEAEDNLWESGASFGQLHIGTATFDLTPTSPQPVQTSANLDQLLQYALAQVRPHAVITGNLLTAQEYRLFPWGNQPISSPPPVVQVQTTQDLAAIIVNDGATAYFPSNPTARTSRWVEIPRLPGFYALATEDQNRQRQAWITRLREVRTNLQVPGVTITREWLDRRAMPALRLLLAHFATQCFPVKPVDTRKKKSTEKEFLGGKVNGVTLPLISFPLREPECYLPVIAQVEGKLESINAYDCGAGISLGPIQFNVIRGALFRFLGQLQQQDADLFQQELAGPLSWSLHPHGDHHDLIVSAGTPQEIRLHGSASQNEVQRNYAYFQSGNPSQPKFAQINADWRRTVAGRFRNLVVWPHIQEIIMQVSSWWLEPGLQQIHAANIPALDRHNPDEHTFILKALLLSAYVRFSASLDPFLSALGRWNTVAEKLRHWQETLRDSSIPRQQKLQLLARLCPQDLHAREILAAIRRLAGAAASAAPRPAEAVWPEEEPTPWENVPAWEEAAGDLSDEEAFPAATAPVPSAADLVELAEAALPAAAGLAPGAWLARFLSEAGLVEGGQPALAEALEPEHLFAALARGRRVPYNFPYADHFQVIGAPGQPIRVRLRPGDLLVRIAPGEFGLGHLAVIASPRLIHRRDLEGHGLAGESHLPGWYVQVVEGGRFPHPRAHAFARRLLDGEGRLLPYQLLLRPESSGSASR